MDITWYGLSCFRIREGGATVICDPYDKAIGMTLPKLRADIVTISHEAPGHNAVDRVQGDPKILRGPGEYETNNVFISGMAMTMSLGRRAALGDDKLKLTRPGSEPLPNFNSWTDQPFLDTMTQKAIEILAGPDGEVAIGTGLEPPAGDDDARQRRVRIDGAASALPMACSTARPLRSQHRNAATAGTPTSCHRSDSPRCSKNVHHCANAVA